MSSFLKNLRETLTPVRTSSAFLTKGVLTPLEFVAAGDELVYKCPTWSWEAGDPSLRRHHLPADKQYLITRNVPCVERADSVEVCSGVGETDEDGWFMDSVKAGMADVDDEEDFECIEEVDDINQRLKSVSVSSTPKVIGEEVDEVDEEEDDYADMDGFDGDDNVIEDDDVVLSKPATTIPTNTNNTNNTTNNNNNNNVKNIRTYDMSISYDKYYQTPRVWLFGYDENRSPLSGDQTFQDVMSDYARTTVTIETHHHTGQLNAAIHPCQHGKVMKNIVGNLMKGGDDDDNNDGGDSGPSVNMYLFIFLKFVSSIIPTVNYDFTIKVDVGKK